MSKSELKHFCAATSGWTLCPYIGLMTTPRRTRSS